MYFDGATRRSLPPGLYSLWASGLSTCYMLVLAQAISFALVVAEEAACAHWPSQVSAVSSRLEDPVLPYDNAECRKGAHAKGAVLLQG